MDVAMPMSSIFEKKLNQAHKHEQPDGSIFEGSIQGEISARVRTSYVLGRKYVDVHNFFSFMGELGQGSFGVVNKCRLNIGGNIYACKSIKKACLTCHADVDDIVFEIYALKTLQVHPAVVKLRGAFEDSESINLMMEYCEGGDLFNKVKERRYFSEPEAAIIVARLASVLSFAHRNGIMHRDIKLENILLVSKTSDTDIRLADFGSATLFRPGERLSQLVGSPLYVAPSVLQQNYGVEADLWSLGVVLYILLCGSPPFFGANNAELFRKTQCGAVNLSSGKIGSVSSDARNLVSLLMERDTSRTITASDVLDHPWIRRHCYPTGK